MELIIGEVVGKLTGVSGYDGEYKGDVNHNILHLLSKLFPNHIGAWENSHLVQLSTVLRYRGKYLSKYALDAEILEEDVEYKDYRKRNRITLKQMAHTLGVSLSTYKRYEREGKRGQI